MSTSTSWFTWAAMSAVFAALTAIFAKIGIQAIDSDLATFVRTTVVLLVLGLFVWLTGKWSNPLNLPAKTWLFLVLSALATGASWVCYFRALQLGEASKVAPVDKFSLVLVAVFAVAFLGERPSPQAWLGIGLVAAGVLLLALTRWHFIMDASNLNGHANITAAFSNNVPSRSGLTGRSTGRLPASLAASC